MAVEFRSGARNMRAYFEARPEQSLGRHIDNYFNALSTSGQFRWLGVFEIMENGGRTKVVFCPLEVKNRTPKIDGSGASMMIALASMAGLVGSNVTIHQRTYNGDVTPYGVECDLPEVMSKESNFKNARLLWQGDV